MSLLNPIAKGRWRPEALFRPASLVVIGAASGIGGQVMANLLQAPFTGAILPVDAAARSVSGVLTYPDIAALPMVPDLAVLTGSGDQAAVLAALARHGTFAAIQLADASASTLAGRAGGVRVLGPASFGLCVPGIGLNASTGQAQPRAGRIALVSQSASLCRAVLDWAGPNGVGFSHVVGLGTGTELDFAPVLDWLSRDPETGAILLAIRSIADRRAFLSAARAASRLRPVVAIRTGGRQADPSGDGDQVFDAALRRSGVLRVTRFADLLAAAETLTRARPARSETLAIVSNSLGAGQIAADAALAAGLTLAQAPDAAKLATSALPTGAARDGLVYAGADRPERLADAARLVGNAPETGGVLAILAPIAGAELGVAALVAAAGSLKAPLLVCAMGETTGAGHRRTLAEAGVPAFASPELAVRGFDHLVQNRRARAASRELPPSAILSIAPDQGAVRGILALVRDSERTSLLQDEALAVLAAYGLSTVPTRVAADGRAVLEATAALGYPAVVKLRRSAQPRPGGPGGVMLDLRSPEAVALAVDALDARRAALAPGRLDGGFLVQRQVGRARELRAKVVNDPLFGPAIGFGEGGSVAELFGDMAWDLPPLNLSLARSLIGRSRAARTLVELHDHPAADTEAVADALVRISQLLVDFPEIAAVDVNPIFAGASGAVAADAWIGLRPGRDRAHLAIAPFPAELASRWTAADETLVIRPIRPEDAEAHAALFHRLSPEDVRYRFFSALRSLPPEQVARLTQVDYDREMAFVAVREGTGETVGVARLVREADTSKGEFAILVESSMKGRGLGRRLMESIIAWARSRGMTGIVGQVLAENLPMLAFIRRLGFRIVHLAEEPDVVEAHLTL